MKVLLVHNSYQTQGGEDSVLANEAELLRSKGVDVELYLVKNSSVNGFLSKVSAFLGASFSIKSYLSIRNAIKCNSPDVVHVHNYFPLISPSVFYACNSLGVPVVHTLHNYRAICPTALLMHEGEVCEKSISNSSWWAVKKKVYRESYIGSLALTLMVELHKRIGTWSNVVNRYVALTSFAKDKYVEAGWPEEKVLVKSNFVSDVFSGEVLQPECGYAVYVGRLSEEKGVNFILEGFRESGIRLKILGDGPLRDEVVTSCNTFGNIEYLGLKDKQHVLETVQGARFIIMASTWYEGLPMVLVEAFACSTPALVPRLGGMAEVVDEGVNGLHYEPGNIVEFIEKSKTLAINDMLYRKLSEGALRKYRQCYSPDVNFSELMEIYKEAIEDQKHASKA